MGLSGHALAVHLQLGYCMCSSSSSASAVVDIQVVLHLSVETAAESSHLMVMPFGFCLVGVFVGVFLATDFFAGRFAGLLARASCIDTQA